jgi:hypothetical protein
MAAAGNPDSAYRELHGGINRPEPGEREPAEAGRLARRLRCDDAPTMPACRRRRTAPCITCGPPTRPRPRACLRTSARSAARSDRAARRWPSLQYALTLSPAYPERFADTIVASIGGPTLRDVSTHAGSSCSVRCLSNCLTITMAVRGLGRTQEDCLPRSATASAKAAGGSGRRGRRFKSCHPTVEIPGQGQCPRTATLALNTFRGGSGEILEKILESVSTMTAFSGRI